MKNLDKFKFRAWNPKTKKMAYWELMDETFEETKHKDISSDSTIMQYTGLKDKNGKLIFEGDIVKNGGYKGNGSIGIVEFGAHGADSSGGEYGEVECYGWYIRTADYKENDYPWKNGEFPSENIEIIGNIYKNPELINL